MGGEKIKWCQPAHHQLWSQQRPHLSTHSTAKTNDSSGRMVSSGTVIASVHCEKTRLKKLMMTIMKMIIIIIMNKSQETTVFRGRH